MSVIKTNGLQYRILLQEELQDVKRLMLQAHQNIPINVSQAIDCIIQSGGKRLRPALVLLSSYICGANMQQAIPLAAAIEMMHTATLIHDDLIDNGLVRRGVQTLNALWSPSATVLAGDLAFAWAAKLATQGQNLHFMERFAETLDTICNGELQQMFYGRGKIPTHEEYYERIFSKTASLFMLTTETGPLIADCPPEEIARMAHFGKLLGLAFQIADDVLDLMGSEEILGKPVGSDLRQGLITLPLLYYLDTHPEDKNAEELLAHPDTKDEAKVQALVNNVRQSDAAERAMTKAKRHIQQACEILDTYPDTPYRRAMEEIAQFAIRRRY